MKWIGQHIWDLISRFRSDVYLDVITSGSVASGDFLGIDTNGKVVKTTGGVGNTDGTYDNKFISTQNAAGMATPDEWRLLASFTISKFRNQRFKIIQSEGGPNSNTAVTSEIHCHYKHEAVASNAASGFDGTSRLNMVINNHGHPSHYIDKDRFQFHSDDYGDTGTIYIYYKHRNSQYTNLVWTVLGFIEGTLTFNDIHVGSDVQLATDVASYSNDMYSHATASNYNINNGVYQDILTGVMQVETLTKIKVLPGDFKNNPNSGSPNYIHDTVSARLSTRGHDASDSFYAFVEIPGGYKATHVIVHASSSVVNGCTVKSYDYTTGTTGNIADSTFNFNQTNDITDIASSDTQDLVIKCTPGTSAIFVYGATVTLARI